MFRLPGKIVSAFAVFGWIGWAAGEFVSPAWAQTPQAPTFFRSPLSAEVTFSSVADANRPTGSAGTFVENPMRKLETPAERTQWPASFFYRWQSARGVELCSATMIGSQTLITAAHCIPASRQVSIVLGGEKIDSIGCEVSDSFAVPASERDIDVCEDGGACAASFDVALCLLKRAPVVTKIETVTTDPSQLAIGARVMLTGFGCTTRSETGGTEGGRTIFTLGWASVRRGPLPQQANYYALTTGASDVGQGSATIKSSGSEICPGDSGGGAYMIGLNSENLDYRRFLAVNSAVRQVEASSGRWLVKGPSFLVPLSVKPIAELLIDWPTKKLMTDRKWKDKSYTTSATDICGIGSVQSGLCR
jgi:hypothetical protein